MEKLNKCQFCVGENIIIDRVKGKYWGVCKWCYHMGTPQPTKKEAIESWNKENWKFNR